jgi:hypothetical protein
MNKIKNYLLFIFFVTLKFFIKADIVINDYEYKNDCLNSNNYTFIDMTIEEHKIEYNS